MEQKEIICRLLTALREDNDHSKKMHNHLEKFDVDTDLFASSPLDNAVCSIVTSVIKDTHLLSWWIYGNSAYYTAQNGRHVASVYLDTAEKLWDYHFENKGAEEAQN